MKKTTKVILSSALTMGLCASLIAGSTLAMFSSRNNVNVAITSGKVDVVASVDTDSLKGYSTEWEESVFDYVQKPTSEMTKDGLPLPDNTFYAGGTFTYEAGELKLDSIAPGDAVEFNLKIENKSTLAIQYRVQLTVPTENQNGEAQGSVVKELQVSFNDGDPVTIGDESTFAQKWSDPIDKGVAIEETPKVRVELPYELGNDYQGQSCLLHVGVYAVQLGTHVADADGTYNAYTAADLLAISNLANSGHTFVGETIELGADIDLSPDSDGGASTLSVALADTPATIAATSSQAEFGFDKRYNGYEFQGTFNGNGYRISNFKNYLMPGGYENTIEQGQGAGLFNVLRNATVENLILSNVTIVVDSHFGVTAKAGYAGILAGKAYNSTIRNIVIENSSVKSTTNFDRKYYEAHHGHGSTKGAEPDYVGALVGEVFSATTVENVKITLNEDVGELIGNETRSYPGYAGSSNPNTHTPYEVVHTGNKLVGGGAEFVNYVGTSTLVCIPAAGMEERMTFSKETSGVPSASVEIGSVEGLASLTQSVQGGRDYSGTTITLTDDIDLSEAALEEIGAFKGTIDGGAEGHTISGLDLKYFSNVSAIAMAASVEEAPTLKNVTLEFTKFTGVENWRDYITAETLGSFIDTAKINLCNSTIALQDEQLRYELRYDGEGSFLGDAVIGLKDGDPETGDGYDIVWNDTQFNLYDSRVFQNVKFTGNSYINIVSGGTEESPITLTIEGCYADVHPAKLSNAGRAAFIVSTNENAYVKYDISNNSILSAQSTGTGAGDGDFYSAAIFSWANVANGSRFHKNHFGNATAPRYTFIGVKLMNFAKDAKVNFTENEVYGTTQYFTLDAFDLYQNNSRANTYSAFFKDNKVYSTGEGKAYFLFVEANVMNAENPAHGRVYVTETNTLNGQKVVKDSYDPDTFEPSPVALTELSDPSERPNKFENLAERKQAAAELEGIYQYDFVSWEVTLNDSDQIVSGTFVLGEDFNREQLLELAAPDADPNNIKVYNTETGLITVGDGKYAIDSAEALVALGNYMRTQEDTLPLDVILTANINLADVELPEWEDGVKATGTIDGNGHIVYGVKPFMDGDYTKKVTYRTIFGHMDSSSTIKNVNFLFEFDAAWQKDFDNGIGASGNGVKPNFFKEVGTIENIVLVMKNQDGTKGLIYSSCGDSNKFDIGGMGSVPQDVWDRVKDVL